MRCLWDLVNHLSISMTNTTDILYSWLVFKVVDIIRYRAVQHDAVIATGIITNVLILISVLSALPWVRKYVTCIHPMIFIC